MTTTLADRFAAALAAFDDAARFADLTAARLAALTYAAAWHEVNGATIRADDDALTRARADLAAERKAWQEATEMESPPAAKGRIDLLIGDLTRARDCRSSLIGAREQAEQERNVAVVARGLAETAAKEATARAEAAEREVARLTGAGAASDDDLDVVYAHASDDGDNDAGGRRAVYSLGLAHGRAAAPPPDASDEEIARALYAATAVPGAYDDLPWSVTEPRQRAGWIAAVTTVIRPRLDALRADVARLTAPGPSSKCPADFASYIRDFGTTEGPYRLGLAHGRTESRAEVDRLATALATAEQQRDALAANLAAAEEACVLHEQERDVAQAERDDARREIEQWRDATHAQAPDRVRLLDAATLATATLTVSAPQWVTGSDFRGLPYEKAIVGKLLLVAWNDGSWTVDDGHGRELARGGRRHDRDIAIARKEATEFAVSINGAVVDTGATPPAALPQVEAFELPAVKWTEEVGGGAERSVGARHRAVACGDGSWRLTIDGKTTSSAESKARVEDAVALLAGRAEVRR